MSKIKEEKLQQYKDYVDDIFYYNNIAFTAKYIYEEDDEKNSLMCYTVGHNIGIICHIKDKNKLGCSVIHNGKMNYLEKEGFSPEFIEAAPIWIEKGDLDEFITFMAYPKNIIFKNE